MQPYQKCHVSMGVNFSCKQNKQYSLSIWGPVLRYYHFRTHSVTLVQAQTLLKSEIVKNKSLSSLFSQHLSFPWESFKLFVIFTLKLNKLNCISLIIIIALTYLRIALGKSWSWHETTKLNQFSNKTKLMVARWNLFSIDVNLYDLSNTYLQALHIF